MRQIASEARAVLPPRKRPLAAMSVVVTLTPVASRSSCHIGRPGPSEGATLCGDRRTGLPRRLGAKKSLVAVTGEATRPQQGSVICNNGLKSTTLATSVDFIGLEIASSRRKKWRTDTHSGRAFRQIADRMLAFGGPTVFHIDQY